MEHRHKPASRLTLRPWWRSDTSDHRPGPWALTSQQILHARAKIYGTEYLQSVKASAVCALCANCLRRLQSGGRIALATELGPSWRLLVPRGHRWFQRGNCLRWRCRARQARPPHHWHGWAFPDLRRSWLETRLTTPRPPPKQAHRRQGTDGRLFDRLAPRSELLCSRGWNIQAPCRFRRHEAAPDESSTGCYLWNISGRGLLVCSLPADSAPRGHQCIITLKS